MGVRYQNKAAVKLLKLFKLLKLSKLVDCAQVGTRLRLHTIVRPDGFGKDPELSRTDLLRPTLQLCCMSSGHAHNFSTSCWLE